MLEKHAAQTRDNQYSALHFPGPANRLKFTPDGKRVLVSSGPELVVLDAETRKVVKRIPIGHGSGGLLVEPDGARAFVSCGPDNYVAVIDLRAMAVIGHIEAGRRAGWLGVGFSPMMSLVSTEPDGFGRAGKRSYFQLPTRTKGAQ